MPADETARPAGRQRGPEAPSAKRSSPDLSPRQLECPHRIAQGETTVEIALALGLSRHTVDHYVSAACDVIASARARGPRRLLWRLLRRSSDPRRIATSRSSSPCCGQPAALERGWWRVRLCAGGIISSPVVMPPQVAAPRLE
jgi:DNA-binding CsgD family transcriptional regulator